MGWSTAAQPALTCITCGIKFTDPELHREHFKNYCIACGKNFKSRKAYLNHLDSKKHKEMILKSEAKPPKNETPKEDVEMEEEQDDEDLEIEEVDSDEWEEDG